MPDFSLQCPLTRLHFREDLRVYFISEMKQTFTEVLRSHLAGGEYVRSLRESFEEVLRSHLNGDSAPHYKSSNANHCRNSGEFKRGGGLVPRESWSQLYMRRARIGTDSMTLQSFQPYDQMSHPAARSSLPSCDEEHVLTRATSGSGVSNASVFASASDRPPTPKWSLMSRLNAVPNVNEDIEESPRRAFSSNGNSPDAKRPFCPADSYETILIHESTNESETNLLHEATTPTSESDATVKPFIRSYNLRKSSSMVDFGSSMSIKPRRVSLSTGKSHWSLSAYDVFVIVSTVMVLLNALCVGLDTDYRLSHNGKSPDFASISEPFFCIYFVIEIGIRIYVDHDMGWSFFCGDGRHWNVFEFVIVFLQAYEQCAVALGASHGGRQNFASLRVLRIVRIVRIVRVVRVVHMFDELRQLVGSMVSSGAVLMWSLLVLFLVIYLFSVVFLQVILEFDGGGELEHHAQIHRYFSSLPRTIFTMFEAVVGGVNWDDVVSPVMRDISPYLGIVFSVYVAASQFAIMNMLTGIFVDRATTCIREDRDLSVANQIRELFLPQTDEDDEFDTEIDFPAFQEKMQSSVMQNYLLELGVNVSDAGGLFDLLDFDSSGSLSSQEIVDGCLQLRAQAKVLDLALIMRALMDMQGEFRRVTVTLATRGSANKASL